MAAAEPERPPLPPFEAEEDALRKVKIAEQAWNTRDPVKVSLGYTPDSEWHVNGVTFAGREAIVKFLTDKWNGELDYRLEKTLWCFKGNRIAVVYRYEHHDASGQWFRAHGNEDWEFAPNGQMQRRITQINKVPIEEKDRMFKWDRETHYA
ncbi:hypothetical protein WJX81_006111 [Elliptochloris bilobata]|uniref:Uncharacterized protein n=1 Tax=Elliptochloris bilobata TaxID=381761 RepID=A0AAW1SHV7_9CHLO